MREKNVAKESKRERQPRGESKLKKRKVPLHDKVEHSCRERKKKKKKTAESVKKGRSRKKWHALFVKSNLLNEHLKR
jgi:hypothetical protein